MTDKTILIIEDDDDIRLGLTVLLEREFRTICGQDATTAMTLVRRERPDVILLDLGLPGGDGMRILRWIQDVAEVAQTPVIVVTGRDGDHIDDEAMKLGAAAVFRKPADTAELMQVVRDLCDHPLPERPRILVVDDDEDTRESLAIRLRANDFVVSFASDGAAALASARNQRPDLMVLDLGLPAGDGIAVMERLRDSDWGADLPVVVMSGREPEQDLERVISLGAQAYLQKPADEKELLDVIGASLCVTG